MVFLNGKVWPICFKHLAADFDSTLINSIYMDVAMVSQHQEPKGTSALAEIVLVWNIIYGLGLLVRLGGSAIFNTLSGRSGEIEWHSNGYVSAALISTIIRRLSAGRI